MIEKLEQLDRNILLLINSHHTDFLDRVMWVISSSTVWIPCYILLIYLVIKKFSFRKGGMIILITIASVGASDFISSSIIKNQVQRYRPTHNLEIKDQLHVHVDLSTGEEYRGGQYGFVSSHAANFFAMAVFLGLIFRKYYPELLFYFLAIACVVSYSRMYLGVHYPSDILGGASIGIAISWLFYGLASRFFGTETPKEVQA